MRTHEYANTGTKIIYPELGYKLYGIFYEVHRRAGRYCRESQYANLLEKLLEGYKIKYKREFNISSDQGVEGNRVDFCIQNIILVDVKAKRFITRDDYYQMRRYLNATGLKLGLIVNFQERDLRPKRVLNSQAKE